MRQVQTLSVLSIFVLAASAAAQVPFEPRSDLWVTDSTNDRIQRLQDLDFDGDYDDAGEVSVFYDDLQGPFALGNNNCILSLADGSVMVADTTADFILTLRDTNGDGDAHDIGEAIAYFSSVANFAGIEAQAISGLARSGNVVWAAVAQGGSTGKDFVLRLEDLNVDGDANDQGEAVEYFVRSDMSVPGTTTADSIVQDVEVGNDGNVYYLEIGSNGTYAKGIYQLVDLDQNGTIDPATEVVPYFIPAVQTGSAFHWAIEQDSNGWWYVQDTGNDFIWRARDGDASGTIDPANEASKWWTSPASSMVWDMHLASDGQLYVSESQNNERLFLMRDDDGSGVIEPGEVVTAYDELLALGAPIGQIRGFALDARWQAPWATYCTAQTNSQGCTPAIGAAGWPSASHGSGFLIQAGNVRNNKPGLLLYTQAGQASLPLNGGTLCLASPIKRVSAGTSGGTPFGADCTGAFTVDFNAHIASGANPALIEGVVVDAQYWSRDPGSLPGHTNLTNAIEFTILR
ncbi:MAG TPA: hypothetical protein VK843_06110 [Planctomycetota bacterium]|nr:hypothetical protein [Planctomycetota bacterium]